MTVWKVISDFLGARDSSVAWPLFLVHMNIVLYAMTFWMSRPVLPFLTERLGADSVVFGYLQTTFSFVQLAGNPIIGRLCDVKGAKVALQMCQLATGLSYLLLGGAWNVPLLFVSQLPTVLMQSMHCSQAFVTEFSSEEGRSAALGRLSLSYGAGMAVGPILGGVLSDVVGPQGVALLAGSLMFLPFLVNLRHLPSRRPAPPSSSSSPPSGGGGGGGLKLEEIGRVLQIPACRSLAIFMLFTGLAGQLYHSTFSMAGPKHFGLTARDLGVLQTASALLGLVANTLLVGLAERYLSQIAVVSVGCAALAGCFLWYSVAASFADLAAIVAVSAAPSAAMYTVVTSMLTRSASRDNAATVIGLGHAARSACGIVAPTLGGYIYQSHGTRGIGLTCSAIMAAALAFIQIARPGRAEPGPPRREDGKEM